MAGAPSGMELCPYCRKPFKRLKSHLPHCKMAGDMKTAFDSGKVPSADLEASHSKPVRLLAPKKIKGQSKEKITTTDNGSERESKKKPLDTVRNKAENKLNALQIRGSAGSEIASSLPAEKPGKNTKWQIKLSSEKTHRDEGMSTAQEEAKMHMNAAKERTSKAKHAKKLPTTQKIRSKNTSSDENSVPGGILELSSLNKNGKCASESPNDPIRSSAQQKQRKVESPMQEVAGSLDLPTGDPESIPRAAIEGVKVVIEKHRVKVLRGRNESKIQGAVADRATTGNCMSQRWHMEMQASDCSDSHADTVQSDHCKNMNVTGAMNTHAFSLEVAESNTWSGEGEKSNSLTATEMHVLGDHVEADCRKISSDLIQRDRVDKSEIEEKQFYLNGDVDSKASFSASLAEKPHPTVRETLRGTSEGIASSYLTGVQQLLKDEQRIALVSESVLNKGRRDSELALKQHLFHTSENQPTYLFQSSGRNIQARSIGLEWFPELYPNYHRLSMFPGRPLPGNVEIKMKTIKPSFLEGPQAPLIERCLMDVKIKELPAWLSACDFSPKGLLGAVQKAWSSYCNKYIDVKKGGAAGISMLLAGYCVLSYGWRYDQLKQDRWRKYH
ncbi:mitochondrial nucleoid-associated protein 1 [Emydura macquarii macquarii]|uniref:mitochondrial nucleoid-associated protein 1 n=1 Tax=Emydura macquarii macquarii TaxID=1129001 RepID=UPI00352A8FD7